MDSNLPLLDIEAEVNRYIQVTLVAAYRERLEPYVAVALDAAAATDDVFATMVRHLRAQYAAQTLLFIAEGLMPPYGNPVGSDGGETVR
jgi:hypothetical protein